MQVLARRDLLERVGGDAELAAELLELFASEAVRLRDEIRAAVGGEDREALVALAHNLKGSAANVSAVGVQDAATSLERLGREGDAARVAAGLAGLEQAVEALLAELTATGGA